MLSTCKVSSWRVPVSNVVIILQDAECILQSCDAASSTLIRKVYSLHSTVLCWAASECSDTGRTALIDLVDPKNVTGTHQQAAE
jgi:hypothetical protein